MEGAVRLAAEALQEFSENKLETQRDIFLGNMARCAFGCELQFSA